jgi:hypothetical protein
VPLDTQADEVSPVIWNRRLYLFWTVTTEKADTQTNIISTACGLAWSEYRQGKWTAKRSIPTANAIKCNNTDVHIDVEAIGDELNFNIGQHPIEATALLADSLVYGTVRLHTHNGQVFIERGNNAPNVPLRYSS